MAQTLQAYTACMGIIYLGMMISMVVAAFLCLLFLGLGIWRFAVNRKSNASLAVPIMLLLLAALCGTVAFNLYQSWDHAVQQSSEN